MGGRERRWRWHRHKKEEEEGIDFSQRRIGYSRFDKDIFHGGNAAKLGGNVVCINKLNHAFWEFVVEFPESSHTWYVPYILPGQDLLQSSLVIFFFSWLTGVGAVRRPRS